LKIHAQRGKGRLFSITKKGNEKGVGDQRFNENRVEALTS
jgi:hypothetical protein